MQRVVLGLFCTFVAFGWGCSGGNIGCGTLKPLPAAPPPRGFPPDQQIEGGAQVRITKPGFDKLSSIIPGLIQSQLGSGMCSLKEQDLVGNPFYVKLCDSNLCSNNQVGCPLDTRFSSQDGKDKIVMSMADGTNPVLNIDAAFDFDQTLYIDSFLGSCTMQIRNDHYTNSSADPVHIVAGLAMGIDPTTGELTLNLANLNIVNLGLNSTGCGFLGSVLNTVLGFVSSSLGTLLVNFIVQLIKPQLDQLIQGFVPKPPGLAGVLDTHAMLASFDPPPEAALETFFVAGGYVSAYNGGLNLGMITGMNSDRDPSTRQAGATSEPSLCVPARPVYDLGGPPWNLPLNAPRKNHLLSVAPEFSGMPDPMDMNGVTKDLAVGVSRTFLDVVGFHLYNSGTLCLSIANNPALAQLNAGTISVLVPSLSNILENRKAPIAMVIRPQTPLSFTLGDGSAMDPLIHVHVNDIRIDFYTFIEERYVRIFTLALDMNVGINLMLTMDMNGNPAIQPMITGIDKTSVQARVTNTDLLQEDPQKLAKALLSLIDVAVGQLTGALKPIALPSLMGFSLDGLEITRVQTNQDDFLAIYGSIVQNPQMMMARAPDWVPLARSRSPLRTTAQVLDVAVPPPDVIREAVIGGEKMDERGGSNLPTVTLDLGADRVGPNEWQVRVDGGSWHAWSPSEHLTFTDPAFVLQGHHKIEVRARAAGDYMTEDPTPQVVDVLIDSTPPELKLEAQDGQILLHGWDNVTDDGELRYSWKDTTGWTTPEKLSSIPLARALAATDGGKVALPVKVLDEAGNVGTAQWDFGANDFHGRTTTTSTGGCSCRVADPDPAAGGLALAGLIALLWLGGRLGRRGGKDEVR